MGRSSAAIAADVAAAVSDAHAGVEVWDVQLVAGSGLLRVFIDRETGVDVELCSEVARTLAPFRERHSLEVSSPGLERELVRPDHFERFVGQRVHVRASEAIEGRRTFEGLLAHADADGVAVTLEDGVEVAIPHRAISRANLVWTPVTAR